MSSAQETEALRARAHRLIPSGAQTFSRADNQFPANAPAFASRAQGCRFWDERGRPFVDYSMGLLAVSLGHAHPEVNRRVKEAIDLGTCYSRPSLLEGELAERIHGLIACADMVKFGKNGSDATSAAIRLARHHTGRNTVVRCAQHPFHSLGDWFIASTSRPGGIPAEIGKWVQRFDYNDLESLDRAFEAAEGDVACVIMEPMTSEHPLPGFLEGVKSRCERNGALLIFDEIITGFRINLRGAMHAFGVVPHIATFGKGISNGFPLGVLTGQADIMRHGSIGGNVFLLSSTFGGETIGLSAALATIDLMEAHNVPGALALYGGALMTAFNAAAIRAGIGEEVQMRGHPARPELRFRINGVPDLALKTLFLQEMCRHGVLMDRLGLSWAHDDAALRETTAACEAAFGVMAMALKEGDLHRHLEGPSVEPVFTR